MSSIEHRARVVELCLLGHSALHSTAIALHTGTSRFLFF